MHVFQIEIDWIDRRKRAPVKAALITARRCHDRFWNKNKVGLQTKHEATRMKFFDLINKEKIV
jgi:hypothetical protein